VYKILYSYVRKRQKAIIKQFEEDGNFEPIHDFEHLRSCADKVINQGVKMGEGWLIPAEIAALEKELKNIRTIEAVFGSIISLLFIVAAIIAFKALEAQLVKLSATLGWIGISYAVGVVFARDTREERRQRKWQRVRKRLENCMR
jgi:hypothetical protein